MKGRKTGGRKAGTPNRITGEIKNALSVVLQSEIEDLPALLAKLEPYQRAQIIVKLSQLVLPSEQEQRTEPEQIRAVINWGGNLIPV